MIKPDICIHGHMMISCADKHTVFKLKDLLSGTDYSKAEKTVGPICPY